MNTLEEAKSEADRRSRDGTQWAVCLRGGEQIIGNLFTFKEEPDTYNVGWHFNEKYEGKGYASESAKAFFNDLFNSRDARRIYAYVEDNNHRSQKLCERLGMRRDACFKENRSFISNPDGTPVFENTLAYAVLKKEWLDTV